MFDLIKKIISIFFLIVLLFCLISWLYEKDLDFELRFIFWLKFYKLGGILEGKFLEFLNVYLIVWLIVKMCWLVSNYFYGVLFKL